MKKKNWIILGIVVGLCITCSIGQIEAKRNISTAKNSNTKTSKNISNTGMPYETFTENSSLSVFRDKEFTGKTKSIELYTAKDEYEPAQIIIIPKGKEDLKGIKIEFSDLNGKLSDNTPIKITKDNFEYHNAAFIINEAGTWPFNDWSQGQTKEFLKARHLTNINELIGLRPDPLKPDKVFNAHANKNNTVWLTFYVPKDTVAGTYTGTVSIIPKNGKRTEINISLIVWDFILIKECPLGLLQWGDTGAGAIATGIPEFEYMKIKAKHMVKLHRGNTYINWSPDPKSDFTTFDEQTEELMKLGMNKFSVFVDMMIIYGAELGKGTTSGPGRQAVLKRLYNHLKEKGWLNNFMLVSWDEPDFLKAGLIDEWRKSQKEIIDAGFTNFESEFTGRALGCLDKMIGYAGVWVPHIGLWEGEINNFILARKKAGDRIGWYWGASLIAPGPMQHQLLIEQRTIYWLAYKYQIDLFPFFDYDLGFRDTVLPKLWKNQEEAYPVTRGYIYPNPTPDKNYPFLSSIREEALREGREDYCYLYMLGQLVKKYKKEGNIQLAKEGEDVIAKSIDMVAKSMTDYSTNPSDIFQAKKMVAEAILKLSNRK
ncbi:MAG: hypothetical protein PHE88_10435 [Elusimicrobia bacterium]|nr:hypothetical protein [Elusimicrobiota bacterium]